MGIRECEGGKWDTRREVWFLQAAIEGVELSHTPGPWALFFLVKDEGGRLGGLASEPGQQVPISWWTWVQHCLGRGMAMWLFFWG